MERNSIRVVNGLIRRVIADRDLYGQAARGVREPGLKAILQESAESLTAIAAELQGEVTATGGRPATAGGPMSGVRRSVMEATAKLSHDPDVTYIRTLELMERRLLDAFLRLESSSGDRAIVGRHIARLPVASGHGSHGRRDRPLSFAGSGSASEFAERPVHVVIGRYAHMTHRHARFAIREKIRECDGVAGIFPHRHLHAFAKDAPRVADIGDVVFDDVLVHVQPSVSMRLPAYVNKNRGSDLRKKSD